ncbi:MAG: single-stranded-DNA-specific exonuclease RecJ [Alphaproteobacteria bacterium]|nr:single-stranded-DNA-specific exonuclease RecJ [Alphaproteobacteria bacterium]
MTPVPPPFLGVERSVTGRRWVTREGDDRLALALCQRTGVPDVVGRVLAARGIDPEGAETFLNPTLRALLPDPAHLLDMEPAAARLAAAVRAGEDVVVFGDYDVDGATSSALMKRFIEAAGGRARIYIPDRMTEGYGPGAPALLRLREEGAGLVVTVDCGATAFDPLDAAAEAGLDVIVVDHHKGESRLPRAVAVVNPNRLDESSPHGHLAAVGVAFLLVVMTNRVLRESGWFKAAQPVPDPLQWLDLVALGTVCDVVPLVGVNRALVAQGLKVAARRGNAGLRALADVAKLQDRPDAWHLGYMLGPRVNAGGRVGEADMGARLLSCDDDALSRTLAQALDAYNGERQLIEADVLMRAMEQVEGGPDDGTPLVFASGDGWHPGVIGIVAGRLKERYNRPVCVVAVEGEQAKGSGRSVPGIDLGSAVIAARQAGLLEKGGGHAMAAGFTVRTDRLDALRAFLGARLAAQVDEGGLEPVLHLDGAMDAGAATYDLVGTLSRIGPFGAGNPEPRFAVVNARVVRPTVVGTGHVRCILLGPGGARLKAIAFRSADSELGEALLNGEGAVFHVAGTLRPDTWQGRAEAQLVVDDAAFAVTR